MQLAGIAHVQLTVSDLARSRPFYRALCQHFEMHCQYDLEGNATESGILYFIGGKTGLAIRAAKPQTRTPATTNTSQACTTYASARAAARTSIAFTPSSSQSSCRSAAS